MALDYKTMAVLAVQGCAKHGKGATLPSVKKYVQETVSAALAVSINTISETSSTSTCTCLPFPE